MHAHKHLTREAIPPVRKPGDPETKKVNFLLDADIRGFFDTLNHEWLIKFVEHRIEPGNFSRAF